MEARPHLLTLTHIRAMLFDPAQNPVCRAGRSGISSHVFSDGARTISVPVL